MERKISIKLSKKISFLVSLTLSVFLLILFSNNVLANSCVGANYRFECGSKVNESCKLEGDMVCTKDGFIIKSDNVLIEGGGYTLSGMGIANGIYSDKSNTIIRNLKIRNFENGTFLYGSVAPEIIHSSLFENKKNGIFLYVIINGNISQNKIFNNEENGIFAKSKADYLCYNIKITENNISNNKKSGIYLGTDILQTTIKENLIQNNGAYGLYQSTQTDGLGNVIEDNFLLDNGIDFYAKQYDFSIYYPVKNLTLNSGSFSFNYFGTIAIKGIITPQSDPMGYSNLSKYINITNFTVAWIYLNISYEDSDWQNAGITNESSLRIWRHNGTSWNNSNLGTSTNSVNTVSNYVYANITNFGIFNVFGKLTCSDGTSYNSCSSTKPLFCNNGQLMNKCTVCGCRSLYTCNSTSNLCVRRIMPVEVALKD